MRSYWLILLTFAVLVNGAVSTAPLAQDLFNESVEYPFAKPSAIAALRDDILQNSGPDGLARLPPNADTVLPHLKTWGYRIYRNSEGIVLAEMIQDYDSDGIIESLRTWLSGLRKGGCSFINPSDPVFSVGDKRIDFLVELNGKKRTCGEILGVGYATDLASISGRATGFLEFGVSPSNAVPNFQGKIDLHDPVIDINVNANSILGINVSSVAGHILNDVLGSSASPISALVLPSAGLPAWALSSVIDSQLREMGGRAGDAAVYLSRERRNVSSEEYNKTLATSQTVAWGFQPKWEMNPAGTRFTTEDGRVFLKILFVAGIPDRGQVEASIDGANHTLRQLRSYGEGQAEVSVEKGDSWRSIARKYYGTELLADALIANQVGNNISSKIGVGDRIIIPPLWKVANIPGKYIVRPGDSFYKICRRSFHSEEGCVSRLMRLNTKVQPRRMRALSVIRVAI